MKNFHVSRAWIAGTVAGASLTVGLLVGAGLASTPSIAQAAADRSAETVKDVAIVRCRTAGGAFRVSEYQGSVSTPARKTDSCADTLGDLMKAGFAVDRTATSRDADYLVYTLTR